MNKKAVLEGLLFVQGDEGLTKKQMLEILEVDENTLNDLIKQLKEEYNSDDRGITLEILGEKLKMVTKKQHAEYYKKLIHDDTNNTLSPAALETLAIIAYNQPVTRLMIDEIRGVNSSYVIKKLIFQNLIKEMGRSDLPGRPVLYGVTEQFLDYFGLNTTNDLPKIKIEEEEEIEETELFTSKYKEE